jgi:hypothetical protein
MSMAMGGTFQDGFIGSAIGAGVSVVTGYAFSQQTMESIGIVGRTAVAAISGGAASALAGGKFADGAFSAAFFHLFNHESSRAFTVDGRVNKSALQRDGADIYVFRESGDSPTSVLVYEDEQYVGGYRGNLDPDGTSDYVYPRQGPIDGDYKILPKLESQYSFGSSDAEYAAGTPAITGLKNGLLPGQLRSGGNATFRIHQYGGSTGCQTAPIEWADRIWDITSRNPLGSVRMHIKTSSTSIGIPVGPKLSAPNQHTWRIIPPSA